MKKFIAGFFTFITGIVALVYVGSCLTPYINPNVLWPMGFLALGFPYLAGVMFVFLLPWLFINRKGAVLLIILFLLGFQNLQATFAVHFSHPKDLPKRSQALRLLTWNVRGFDNPSMSADFLMSIRRQMFTYLKKVNADVVCFQEFSQHHGADFLSNSQELYNLGFVYQYKTNEQPHYFNWGSLINGTAIFSKYPINDSGKVLLGDTTYPENIAYIDILFQQKPMRIFTTHFKSINLFAQLIDVNNKVIFHGDFNFIYDASKFEKLKVFAQEHAREATIAKAQLNKSPYPVVFVADMNSVPASYAYHTMARGLQDAFISKGFGLGTTLDSLPKTLRIDFMLIDKKLSIDHFQKDDLHLSDHFPQYVDLSWKQ